MITKWQRSFLVAGTVSLLAVGMLQTPPFALAVNDSAPTPTSDDSGLTLNDPWVGHFAVDGVNARNTPITSSYHRFVRYNQAGYASSSTVGDVKVDLLLKPVEESNSSEAAFVVNGARTTPNGEGASATDVYAYDEKLGESGGVSIMVSPSAHCLNNTRKPTTVSEHAEVLNYQGVCDMADMTIKFDRPVSDPIVDFTGIGGAWMTRVSPLDLIETDPALIERLDANGTLNEWFMERFYVRGTYVNQIFTLATEGATLERLGGSDASNFVVNNNTVDLREYNAYGTCETGDKEQVISIPDNKWPGGKRPEHFSADAPLQHAKTGCGSVLVKGENLTELKFKLSTRFTPFSRLFKPGFGGVGEPGQLWNVSADKAFSALKDEYRDFPGRADGINGNFWPVDWKNPTKRLFNAGDRPYVNGDLATRSFTAEPSFPVSDLASINLRMARYSVVSKVWVDENADGMRQNSEPVQPNVVVELLGADGKVLQTQTTDAQGQYAFKGLNHNVDYKIRITPPDGYVVTQRGQAGQEWSSKADPETRTTGAIRFNRDEYLANPAGTRKVAADQFIGIVKPTSSLEVAKKFVVDDRVVNGTELSVVDKTPMRVSVHVVNTGTTVLKNLELRDDSIPASSFHPRDGFNGTLKPGEEVWFDADTVVPPQGTSYGGKVKVNADAFTIAGAPMFDPQGTALKVLGSSEAYVKNAGAPSSDPAKPTPENPTKSPSQSGTIVPGKTFGSLAQTGAGVDGIVWVVAGLLLSAVGLLLGQQYLRSKDSRS